MAASKAQNPEVKSFAQKMVDDHGKMLEDLKSLAKSKGVALPDNAPMKEMAQSKLLEHKSGAEFDKDYMEHMVKDHEKDMKDTESIAAKANQPVVPLLLYSKNHPLRVCGLDHYRHRKWVVTTTPNRVNTSIADSNQPIASTDIAHSEPKQRRQVRPNPFQIC